MKKRILGMDFVRALATIAIFTFHFDMGGRQVFNSSLFFRNIDLGSFGVSLFFILSGAALIYSEKDNFKLGTYFKKRFLAIFPLFWTAYLMCLFIWENFYPHYFAAIPKKNILLTLTGFDGFLLYKIPSFYLTGEWFLGCIIILYLLYPLLRLGVKKFPIITIVIAIAIQALLNYYYPFEILAARNPVLRMTDFLFGMFYAEYFLNRKIEISKSKSVVVLIVSGILSAIILYANYDAVPIWGTMRLFICGAIVFIFLMEAGKFITWKPLTTVISKISKYSFAIFLVHHPIDYILAAHFAAVDMSQKHLFCIYLMYLIMIILLGVFVQNLTTQLTNAIKHIALRFSTAE